jgi:hypothetical protein
MLRSTVERSPFHPESAPTWAPSDRSPSEPRWRVVDRALRQISARRAALDAEEVRWLREAEALQIWHPLGMVSALDYLERVLGYAPRTAQDRLRVARALGSLSRLTDALASGELSFCAVRELTRVATPATEASWIAATRGKNLREIEDLVADHHPGDSPDDPRDPQARTHVVRFELSAETFALLRQARAVLDDENGSNLADDAFVAQLCSAVLDGRPSAEPTGRARFQIAMTVCERCGQGWQEGAGVQVPVSAAAVEHAMCDAQHVGSIDGPGPERAYQDVPPSVARFAWRRDGGRCRVPGCRSARGLELHHIVHRADGGSHDAWNLILCCRSCHQAHHAGVLAIAGTADDLQVRRPGQAGSSCRSQDRTIFSGPDVARSDVTPADAKETDAVEADVDVNERDVARDRATATAAVRHASAGTTARAHVGGTNRLGATILCAQAKSALTGLGWKPAIAEAAVAAAAAAQRGDVTLERLIFESLRRCPVPKR